MEKKKEDHSFHTFSLHDFELKWLTNLLFFFVSDTQF